jgi:hypothetical protein
MKFHENPPVKSIFILGDTATNENMGEIDNKREKGTNVKQL